MSKKQKRTISEADKSEYEKLFALARSTATDISKEGRKAFEKAIDPLVDIEVMAHLYDKESRKFIKKITEVLDEVVGVREDCVKQAKEEKKEAKRQAKKAAQSEQNEIRAEQKAELDLKVVSTFKEEKIESFEESFKARKHIPIKEQRKITTGTWVRVKWSDGQDTVQLVAVNEKELKSYRVLDLESQTGGLISVYYDQVIDILGFVEAPAIK